MFVGISVLLCAIISILFTSTEALLARITAASTIPANPLSHTFTHRYESIRANRLQPLHAITEFENEVKKWYFITEKVRPEMSTSQASTISAILADTWKSVLISLRVLEDNFDMTQYTSVIAFPDFKVEDTPADFEKIVRDVMDCLTTSSALFQPDIVRDIKTLKKPAGDESSELWVVAIKAQRAPGRSKDMTFFEDLDYDTFEPGNLVKPEVWNNNLEEFPFPSVFDFISEINRPPDPATMDNLRYTFQIKDFKTDLTKMKKKKKNPQEIIDSINCKLTRLKNWRDVLQIQQTKTSNPFTDVKSWQDDVKEKYATLVGESKVNPKRALETQYDKQKTFIKIIDQWSDRLQRNFKYYYQGQRRSSHLNVDFQELILKSEWRKNFVQLVRVFDETPFLGFAERVPPFVPGAPAFDFRVEKDRLDVYSSNYPLDVCTGEMLSWLSRLNDVQDYGRKINPGSAFGRWLPTKCITQQSYSRGFVVERVLHDLWTALSQWEDGLVAAMGPFLQDSIVPASDNSPTASSQTSRANHHDQFLRSLQELNTFTREENLAGDTNVRDMYKEWSRLSDDMTVWLTALIADLNIDTEMNRQIAVDTRRKAKLAMSSAGVVSGSSTASGVSTDPPFDWTRAISEAVTDDVQASESANNVGGQLDTDLNSRRWGSYRPVVEKAKAIAGIIDRHTSHTVTKRHTVGTRATPIMAASSSLVAGGAGKSKVANELIKAAYEFSRDVIRLDGSKGAEEKARDAAEGEHDASGSQSLFTFNLLSELGQEAGISAEDLASGDPLAMLFTLPRYYRGIGRGEEELNQFLDLCKVVLVQTKHLTIGGYSVQMVPLHPQMINQKGRTNFFRKSPHPALLFYLNKKGADGEGK